MIAIFTTLVEAQAYSDKLHTYLTENRPDYNAIKWSDPIESSNGLEWWVKQPIEEKEDLWDVPLDSSNELSNSEITESLPEIGETVTIDNYYLHKGDVIKCRQTHNRTIYEPKDTPALFSFFRDNSENLEWAENEQVEIGWMRIYNDIKYEVIQAHQTQSDWTPDVATTLWKLYVDDIGIPVWAQPTGAHDAYNTGDQVWFPTEGSTVYESLIDANVWSPTAYPAGWKTV